MEWIKNIYKALTLLFWGIYLISIFGVWKAAPSYLEEIDSVFKILISIFIIYYFNPWSKTRFTDFHREVIFKAGMMLFLSSSLVQFLKQMPNIENLFSAF
tara:strand:- start:6446 stop:6745 length:300 start_codon:yes stop_codon:yes gene_type:complete